MKKALAIGLAAAMAVTMTAPVYASDDSESGKGIAKEDLKIGAIYIGDENEGYSANHLNGLKEAQAALGISDDQVLCKYNVPETEDAYEAAIDLAEQGCNIIFATSFGHESYVFQAAAEYPNIQFCHATGTKAHTEGLANYHNAFASIYEGRYLAGVAAGLKLNEMIEAGEFTAEEASFGKAAVLAKGTEDLMAVVNEVVDKVTADGSYQQAYDEAVELAASLGL